MLVTVFGPVVLFLLVVPLYASNSAAIHNTSGGGGDVCENSQRVCLAGDANCVGDQCVCNKPVGMGNFACYKKSDAYAEIKNDPKIETFAHEKVEVPLPCRYLVTHVTTQFREKGPDQPIKGECELKLYSYSFRVRGKFFVYGFDAYINIYDSASNTYQGASIRKVGYAIGGMYTFEEWGKPTADENAPWGLPASVDAFGQTIECTYDDVNNRAIVHVRECSIKITFRPADKDLGKDQVQVPGLSVAVGCTNYPSWLSRHQVMALPPFEVGPTVGAVSTALGMAPEEAFLFRALQGGADQQFPHAPTKCTDLVNTISGCPSGTERSIEAMEMCSFILMWPRFVRCWSRKFNAMTSSDPVLELFDLCVDAICHEKVPECLTLVALITSDPVCSAKALPELTGFDCMFA